MKVPFSSIASVILFAICFLIVAQPDASVMADDAVPCQNKESRIKNNASETQSGNKLIQCQTPGGSATSHWEACPEEIVVTPAHGNHCTTELPDGLTPVIDAPCRCCLLHAFWKTRWTVKCVYASGVKSCEKDSEKPGDEAIDKFTAGYNVECEYVDESCPNCDPIPEEPEEGDE